MYHLTGNGQENQISPIKKSRSLIFFALFGSSSCHLGACLVYAMPLRPHPHFRWDLSLFSATVTVRIIYTVYSS